MNSAVTLLYWNIGKRVKREVLRDQRAEYGKQILSNLSKELTLAFGKGWSEQQLRHCVRCAEIFEDEEIFSTLWRELSWSHIKTIIYIDDTLKRDFYAEMCKMEHWSVRQLNERIDSMLYERTAISKKPEQTIAHDIELLRKEKQLTPEMAFRDPVILDFLGLSDVYSEKDLESAILSHLQTFIMELGSDFAFLARQKRITIDNVDYYIDLLFYHRKLRRLIVIELKLGKFKVEHKSQIELYLRWLDRHEKAEGENAPMGILLCAEKSDSLVELLELGSSGIHIAQYLTELPDKKVLEMQLRKSIEMAKEKFK
ncbi:PDDEXK nuclease domain-containing protein [Bacteroides intestinalis]|uniref:PDDEXK nuclease domain-containing protein n=1 Tax=Bacteroides intestinalis TaxID=329854 RepID=UPI00293D83AA|nr:PDDEXK nuclease domain-containing protein [Bacteroides intestinalis]